MHSLNVITTCTLRKSRPIHARLRVRDVRAGSIAARAADWRRRLTSVQAPELSAIELYAGEHWSIVRSLPESAAAKGLRVNVWVCSAGYGLIRGTTMVRPYGATFALGQPDSVASDLPQTKEWWAAICRLSKEQGAPRTVTELVEAAPRTPLIVALSSAYLNAMHDDLVGAARVLGRKGDLLSIVSAGADRVSPELKSRMLPANARLQGVVGGARQALNARILAHLVQDSRSLDFSTLRLRARLTRLLATAPSIPVYDRAEATDEGIRTFIRHALRTNPASRPTPLLRSLRDSGRACEQSRFGRLFHEVWKENHGSPQPTSP